jgi:alpha-aminoadipate carrier protein LysW
MTICFDCGCILILPEDCVEDEVVSCHDCGMDYVTVKSDSGLFNLQQLAIEGEDWGE